MEELYEEPNHFTCEDYDIEEEEENPETIVLNKHTELLNKTYAGKLHVSQTFGRKGRRMLYKLCPYDKALPYLLVPYDLRIEFQKQKINKYVLFQYTEFNKVHYGQLEQVLGNEGEPKAYGEYMVFANELNFSVKNMREQMKKKQQIPGFSDSIDDFDTDDEDEEIVTYDNQGTLYYDDAVGFKKDANGNTIETYYVTNVSYFMDLYELWDCFGSNVYRNIYLPQNVKRILPKELLDKCSLKAGTKKLVMKNGKLTKIYIKENRVYDEVWKEKITNEMLRRKEENLEISPLRKRFELCKQNNIVPHTSSEIYEEKHKLIRYIERKTDMLTRLDENGGVIYLEDREIYKIGDRIKPLNLSLV